MYHEESIPQLIDTLRKASHAASVVYIAVDFRFDVRERDSDFVAPVLRKFLESPRVALSAIPDEDLDQNFIKNSIRLYKCKIT